MHCSSVGKLQHYSWHHYIQRILLFSGVTILGVHFFVQTVPPRIVFILPIFFYFPSLFMCFCFSVLFKFLFLLIMPIHTHKKYIYINNKLEEGLGEHRSPWPRQIIFPHIAITCTLIWTSYNYYCVCCSVTDTRRSKSQTKFDQLFLLPPQTLTPHPIKCHHNLFLTSMLLTNRQTTLLKT